MTGLWIMPIFFEASSCSSVAASLASPDCCVGDDNDDVLDDDTDACDEATDGLDADCDGGGAVVTVLAEFVSVCRMSAAPESTTATEAVRLGWSWLLS